MKGKGIPIRPTHPRTVKTLQQQKEKKPDATTSGASKIVKPPTKRPELFEIQKSMTTSIDTFSDLVKAFNSGTDDLQQLLDYECEFIFECKVCRNLFRSLANFIQHKRAYCIERFSDFRKKFQSNGEVIDRVVQLNGNNPKGLVVATRKTMRKDIYELLKRVGNFNEEIAPAPENLYTKNIEETEAALHSFFQQEGKAPTKERSATLGPDGVIVNPLLPQTPADSKPSQTSSPNIKPSQLSSTTTKPLSTVNGQQERKEAPGKQHECSQCNQTFSSTLDLNLHTRSRACLQMRWYYTCPICEKAVHTPYSVYRHLRKVHHKSLDQVQKLRDKIRKKFMQVPKSVKAKNRLSPISEMETSRPVQTLGKRCHSPEATRSPSKTIVEVRSYGKSPLQPDLSLPAFMRKQPLVVLTKTAFPPSMASFSVSNNPVTTPSTSEPNTPGSKTLPDSGSQNGQVSPSQPKSSPQLNPPKRAKMQKDLSWLKRGPSVVGGPLTRTARALYGSPKKNKSAQQEGRDKSEDTLGDPLKAGAKNNSLQTRLQDVRPREASPSDNDTEDDDTKEYVSLDDASALNKRLSSSEDNFRSLTSSVHSFDSSLPKAGSEKLDINDRQSTSGIETDVSPDGEQVTPSQSDEESSDIDRLVSMYLPDSPSKLNPCNRLPSADLVSDSGSFGSAEDNGATSDERSCSVRLCDTKTTKETSGTKAEKPLKSAKDSNHPICINRKGHEVAGSDKRLESIPPIESEGRLTKDDHSDSEESAEQQADDTLRSNMMDIIFGSLPSSSYRVVSPSQEDLSS